MTEPRIESRQFGPRACTLTRYKECVLISLIQFFSYLFDQGTFFHEIPLAISQKILQNVLESKIESTLELLEKGPHCKSSKL